VEVSKVTNKKGVNSFVGIQFYQLEGSWNSNNLEQSRLYLETRLAVSYYFLTTLISSNKY